MTSSTIKEFVIWACVVLKKIWDNDNSKWTSDRRGVVDLLRLRNSRESERPSIRERHSEICNPLENDELKINFGATYSRVGVVIGMVAIDNEHKVRGI